MDRARRPTGCSGLSRVPGGKPRPGWCCPGRGTGSNRRRRRGCARPRPGGRPAGAAGRRRGGAGPPAGRTDRPGSGPRRRTPTVISRVAARSRRRGPAVSRASGWLAEALRAQAAADPRRLFAACRRGLDLLDEHRFTLGASELRAQATAHGAELAVLAQRHAPRAHRPRRLLPWAERWRATALAVPAVRPPADAELGASLAALRRVTSRGAGGTPVRGEPPAGAAAGAAAAGEPGAGGHAAHPGQRRRHPGRDQRSAN